MERIDIGDTIALTSLILEGKKERKQKFQGVVIQKRGNYSRESVTIRKVTDGIGIEKTFLIHSPLVVDYQIIKRAKVRRSKLFFLRERLVLKLLV